MANIIYQYYIYVNEIINDSGYKTCLCYINNI